MIDINDLIADLCTCDIIDIVNTPKNRETRAMLGITILDQEDIVRHLTINDFYKGPLKDRDLSRPGDLWVFKKCISGTWFYIKIKEIEYNIAGTISRALSCHIDDM